VHERVIHAGVGAASRVDAHITWPGGRQQIVRGLESNRLHTIRLADAATGP
jgi:hypothetical protein